MLFVHGGCTYHRRKDSGCKPDSPDQKNDIPLTVVWGALDTKAFQKQSADYIGAWQDIGNQGASLIIPGANHFNILKGFEAANGFSTSAVVTLSTESKIERTL